MPNEVLSAAQLKELVKRVVVAQGNTFIKDLLRSTESRIGSTKQEFAQNLDDAIDEGRLTQTGLETWLAEVEGWGDQYVYVLSAPAIEVAELTRGIAGSHVAHLQDAAASAEFPEDLQLKQIAVNENSLSMVWHQGKEGWNRWQRKDFEEEEGVERYRYEAKRQRLDRSVVRFEWQFGNEYCLVLIHRNPDIEHNEVFQAIWEMLALFGCGGLPLQLVPLMQALRTSAQRVNGVQSTRFELDSGYVELASTLSGMGIEGVGPVRMVLQAVNTEQFDRAQGILNFVAHEHGTSRDISIEVFSAEAKLRIWAQCKRDDVLIILQQIWGYNAL